MRNKLFLVLVTVLMVLVNVWMHFVVFVLTFIVLAIVTGYGQWLFA